MEKVVLTIWLNLGLATSMNVVLEKNSVGVNMCVNFTGHPLNILQVLHSLNWLGKNSPTSVDFAKTTILLCSDEMSLGTLNNIELCCVLVIPSRFNPGIPSPFVSLYKHKLLY